MKAPLCGFPCCLYHICDFHVINQIGIGGFSTVMLAQHHETNAKAAIKVIPKAKMSEESLTLEIKAICDLKHPLVSDLYFVHEDSENYYIGLEYMDGGTLRDTVNHAITIGEPKSRFYFCQIAIFLDFLHNQKKIIHRDLKPDNIMVESGYLLKLIDFGLCKYLENTDNSQGCGSPYYASPEMIKGEDYSFSTDIWTAGIVLYIMMFGYLPFEEKEVQSLYDRIIFHEPSYENRNKTAISNDVIDLIRKMLIKDPQKRITINDIVNHPWVIDGYKMLKEIIDNAHNEDKGFDADDEKNDGISKKNNPRFLIKKMIAKSLQNEKLSKLFKNTYFGAFDEKKDIMNTPKRIKSIAMQYANNNHHHGIDLFSQRKRRNQCHANCCPSRQRYNSFL